MDDKFYHGPAHGDPHFHSGPPGKRGLPGVSPKVGVGEVEDGNIPITVTDGYGQRTTEIPIDSVVTDERLTEKVGAWLDDHPEATTTVEDGSITKEKFNLDAFDSELDDASVNAVQNKTLVEELNKVPFNSVSMVNINNDISLSNLLGTYTGKVPQCFCFNGNGFVFGFSGQNISETSLLVEYANGSVTNRVEISAGHCNDIEYVNGKYYIPTSDVNGEFKVFDSSFSLIDTVRVANINYPLSTLAYYNGFLYVSDTVKNLYKINIEDYTSEIINVNILPYLYDVYENIGTEYTQGSCCYDDNLILTIWYGASREGTTRTRLIVINLTSGKVTTNDFKNTNAFDEFEGICVSNNVIRGFSYYDNHIVRYVGMINSNLEENGGKIYLPFINYSGDNTFLDNLTGNNRSLELYYITFSSSHPVLGGNNGYLIQNNVSDTYSSQVFKSTLGTWSRNKNNNVWSDWFKDSGLTTTNLTFNGKTFTFYKVGQMVFVNSPRDMPALASGEHTVGTLPTGFHPFYDSVRIGVSNDTSLKFMTISSAGVVTVYNPSTTEGASNFSLNGSYVAFE